LGRIGIRVKREGKRLKVEREGLMGKGRREGLGEGLTSREGIIVVIIINK
jgi:hypothetical protein